ncbi:class I SAM-dependent methyltransferase (plasmid) [Azospirillum brasilense]|uniref:Class I SAM-dependent methyltransferase n=1 Tax=Azospirillum brasilense TaxID=192 RepID=Q6QW11_AZOBR|nr:MULTISPECIES: class I SAM-dependent methyltransferase [Azospirillum]AAS83054.1 methyltransferase-like protein [Azospirillum brasilense]ALJ39497.1 hypothetical protein AMK58_28750 [Azospirillum brasilense]ALJ39595.1 hypothetical protein AMK58_29285 [Azospirillum brasilense]MDW7555764.1 class I SAM-dependent methyltransferase [Azospirillum brasilense]MDW7595800.1 class I SAM-dependent methyltransferase [Azospirillum brasilense]
MRLTAEEEAPLRRGASPLRTYNDASLSRLLDGLPGMPQSILDVGCGRGHYVEFFRRHGLSGRYLGIDVVPGADWERYAATPSPLEASYRCGPIETVPLPEGAFDLVLSSSALEHVEDDRQAVRRIFAATRPGGLRLHLVPGLRSHLLFGYHGYRRYGAGGLTALFRDAGFEILALHRQGGGVSFLLHMLAIGILESGRTRGVLHDRLRDGGPDDRLRGLACRPWLTGLRRPGPLLAIYAALARAAVRLDPLVPGPTSGYAILVRRP